jgi:hypothetical protein
MFEEDSTVFFDDFAQPVTALGVFVSQGGILDLPQEMIGEDGDVMVTDYMLLVRAADFGRLRMGDVVDVGSVRYRVRRDAQLTIDGEFANVPLMRLKGVRYEAGGSIGVEDTAQPDTVIE